MTGLTETYADPGLFLETAPAKVNLALHVIGRREDGYHDLESLMVFADVADEIEATIAERDSLVVTGPFGRALRDGQSNLVTKALAGFRARWPDHIPHGLAVTLRKNLPIAAGLGGGSADAAAVLRLLMSLSRKPIAPAEMAAFALSLGADVPACLISKPCDVRGVGEKIRILNQFPPGHIVLVNPLIPVPTADIFRRLGKRDNAPMPPLPEPMTLPAQLGLWLSETRNDLELPAIMLVPEIGDMISRLRNMPGCMLSRMSGSGATVFGLFGSGAQAHQAAHELRELWPNHWVAAAPLIQPN